MTPKLIPCGICASLISSDAGFCPNCGTIDPWFANARTRQLGKRLGLVMIIAGTVAVAVMLMGIRQQGFLNYFLQPK